MDGARGLFLGLALGDALGAPHEFASVPYTGRLERPCSSRSRFHGTRYGVVGQVTDDTEMAIALMQAMARPGETAAGRYLAWAGTRPPAMGRNTRGLFSGLKTLAGYQARWDHQHAAPREQWSQANGCLMRCAPLALAADPERAAAEDCRLTNPHPVCVDACVAYVRAVAHVLRKLPGDPLDPLQAQTSEVRDVLSTLAQSRDVRTQKGWVLHGLWCAGRALRAAQAGRSYAECIDDVIRQGGDSDTNAAIAGALVGAYLGAHKMAAETPTRENLRIMLEADYQKGGLPRPLDYHPRAGLQLVEKLVAQRS